ncbi:MAG TPA: hypothetical protein DDW23_05020, partial [Planctomycetes bacterium]|nr:hypothetical protein [Planctomycetota bacterium]
MITLQLSRSTSAWRAAALLLFFCGSIVPLLPCILPLFSFEGWASITDARKAGLLLETAALAIPAAILAMAFGLPVAILASRIHVPGSNLLGFLMPLPLLLPPLMIA